MNKPPESIPETLEICLDLLEQPGETIETVIARFPEHAEVLTEPLEAAAWLRGQRQSVEVRPGFIPASRSRLLKRIRSPRPRQSWLAQRWFLSLPQTRRAVSMAVLVLLFVALLVNASSFSRASAVWLPGDWPYPLKQAYENIELLAAPDAADQARLHMLFAQRRLIEIQSLALEGRYEEIPGAVARFDHNVNAGVLAINRVARRDALLAQVLASELQNVLSSQAMLVAVLEGFTPGPVQGELARVRAISENCSSALQDVLSPGSGQVGSFAMRWPGEVGRVANKSVSPRDACRRNEIAVASFSDSKGRIDF